jgi:hypothetical protein
MSLLPSTAGSGDCLPVGLAWERAIEDGSAPELYDLDRFDLIHPSVPASYLVTGVIYSTVVGLDPTEFSYVPKELADADAALLRKIAWETTRGADHRGMTRRSRRNRGDSCRHGSGS